VVGNFTHLQNFANTLNRRKPLLRHDDVESMSLRISLEYITVLGTHFELDPTLFASQVQAQVWVERPTENNTPPLIQGRHPRQSFTLRYRELRYFEERIAGLYLVDNMAGRKITTSMGREELSVFHQVGAIRRCISFWCKQRSKTGFWDGNIPV
jgi:hypothetical protein